MLSLLLKTLLDDPSMFDYLIVGCGAMLFKPLHHIIITMNLQTIKSSCLVYSGHPKNYAYIDHNLYDYA